jgi:hypothetical protein
MDGSNITEAPKRAQVVRREEIIFNNWAHIIEEGTPWETALERDYWSLVLGKFRQGDTVTIHSADHQVAFTMYIADINQASDPVYLLAAFLPIYPVDLRLPAMPRQIPPRCAVRQAPGASTFRVIDLETGLPVHDNTKDRPSAMEYAAELERGLAFSGAQVASAFARHHATGGGKRHI